MNRERAKELLPIIRAFAEGKTIQFAKEGEMWIDLPDNENLILTFPADDYDYRIKPEPRVFWISPSYALTSKEFIPDVHDSDNFIKVIEIIE